MNRYEGFGVLILGAIILSVLGIIWSYNIIPPGHVGVVKRFGAVKESTFDPGLHFKLPFMESTEIIDTRLNSINASAGAASKDLQDVQADIAIQYYLIPNLCPRLVDSLGSREMLEAAVLDTAIQESVKAITAKYDAEELITDRSKVKVEVSAAITDYINTTLKEKGLGGLVRVANMGIKNFKFSDEFNAAIEAKVQAQQEALKALNQKTRRITDAEAAAAEVELAAKAEAYRTTAQAVARAKAIDAEGEALRKNPSVISLRAVEKWNGDVPRVSGGGVVPFLNLGENILQPSTAQR